MLQSFRNFAGTTFTKVFLALIVLSFVLWGMGDIVRHSSTKDAAVVAGTRISQQNLEQITQGELSRLKAQVGAEAAEYFAPTIKAQALDKLVNRTLLLKAAQDEGLIISDELIAAEIKKMPIFQDEKGIFSREKYDSVKARYGSEAKFISAVREDKTLELLTSLFEKIAFVPDNYLQAHYLAQHEIRKVELTKLSASAIKKLPEATDAELNKYFENNKQNYAAPEMRKASYIRFSNADIETPAVNDEEITQEFEANIDSYSTPEKLDLKQIRTDSKEEATKILAAIKKGGNFDKASKEVLKMDLVTKADLPESLATAVFSQPQGGVTEVLESELGFHIFKVIKKTEKKQAKLKELQDKIKQELISRKKEELLYQRVTKIDDDLAASTPLQEIAAKYGLKVQETSWFSASGKQDSVPDDLQSFVSTAFKLDMGTNSNMVDAGKGAYYALSVLEIKKSEVPPLDQVKAQVVKDYTFEKKQEVLKDSAGIIFADNNPASKAKEMGLELSREVVTLARAGTDAAKNLPPQLIDSVFSMPLNKASEPYQAGDAYISARPLKIIPAAFDAKGQEAKIYRNTLNKEIESDLFTEYMRLLKEKYGVKINQEAIKLAQLQ